MNAEIKTLNRFEEAGLNPGQSKAMAIGIDDLLVRSMAVIKHRFDAIDHRVKTLENLMCIQMIGSIGVMVAILIGFASLFYVISK